MKISINIIATNKYIEFVSDLIQSINEYFFKDCEIFLILYTNNSDFKIELPDRIELFISHIEHEPWPLPTLKRFHYFMKNEDKIRESEYSFYVDADSLFINNVKGSILPQNGLIGTIHPCLFNTEGTPERNPSSLAYIPHGSGNRYFCGGFIGGSANAFIAMSSEMIKRIDSDLSNGLIAIWHDESHINRFFFENPPEITLEHPFAVAENMTQIKKESVILFLDKNNRGGHKFFRN
jgi:hypothetical protein